MHTSQVTGLGQKHIEYGVTLDGTGGAATYKLQIRRTATATTADEGKSFYIDNVAVNEITDNLTAGLQPDVMEHHDYDPFGMQVAQRSTALGKYRYGFQGQEKDNELKGDGKHISFGDYGLDVRTGRRWNMDPVMNSSVSSYAVFNDNPLRFVDPTGETPYDWIKNKNGVYQWDSKVSSKADTPAGYTYVGNSIGDVQKDYKRSHPILSFFGFNPTIGPERGKWSGEITAPEDKNSWGANWSHLKRGAPGERAIYEFANGLNVVVQMALARSVSDSSMRNLDGTSTTTDQGILGLYSTASTFAPLKTPTFTRTGTGFRALSEEYAESTIADGFYRSGNAGRLGNDGIYINNTVEGALKEFYYHNPSGTPALFEVKYPLSRPLYIDPPSGYFKSPLPFTQDANILIAPSVRAAGTSNLLIREGATVGKQIKL